MSCKLVQSLNPNYVRPYGLVNLGPLDPKCLPGFTSLHFLLTRDINM